MRRAREAVCKINEIAEGIGKVFPLGSNGGECALFVVDGCVLATGSICPHQNSSLDQAKIENGKIVCKRHGFVFDPKTGDCLTLGGYGLPIYAVDVLEGVVWVSYWDFEG